MAVATDTVSTADETAAAAAAAAAGNNPVLLGIPSFVLGGIPLALFLLGYQDGAIAGLMVNIILVSGMGLLISAIWAIKLGAGAVGAIFGLFSSFWLSFALLLLGTTHGWFGSSALEDTTEAAAANAAAAAGGTIVFVLSWTIAVAVLTLATLRLPLAFSVLIFLVAVALFLVLMANLTADTIWGTLAGYVALAFSLLGVYIFLDAMGQALGGKALPLGNPIPK